MAFTPAYYEPLDCWYISEDDKMYSNLGFFCKDWIDDYCSILNENKGALPYSWVKILYYIMLQYDSQFIRIKMLES